MGCRVTTYQVGGLSKQPTLLPLFRPNFSTLHVLGRSMKTAIPAILLAGIFCSLLPAPSFGDLPTLRLSIEDLSHSVLVPIPGSGGPSSEASDPPLPPTQRATLSPDVNSLVAGNNRFAFSLFQHVASASQSDGNMLISPFSISSALAMTYAGARGNTASQMASVLGFNLPDDRLHPAYGELLADLTTPREAYQLSVANRLFGQAGYPFKQSFLDVTSQDYRAPLEPTDFVHDAEGSRLHINDWVADQTHDKIKDLLPQGSVTSDTRLVLTNAIYFNGKWNSKFDEQYTADRPFVSADGTSTPVKTMFQQHEFRYGQFDGYKMLEMPYAGLDLSMVIVLPTAANGLNDVAGSLSSDMLAQNLSSMHQSNVNVFLPKFKFDASFSLGKTLRGMGMTDAFLDPDFSGISDQGLAISDVIHKAYIDVNEAGTEAAAATAVVIGVTCACGPPQPQLFNADHPFLFALRDTHSGSLLFMGRVMRPGSASITSLTGPAVPEPGAALMLLVGACVSSVGRLRARSLGQD
jgi:serpin B